MEIEGHLDRKGVPVWFGDGESTDGHEIEHDGIDRDSAPIKTSYVLNKEGRDDRANGGQTLGS